MLRQSKVRHHVNMTFDAQCTCTLLYFLYFFDVSSSCERVEKISLALRQFHAGQMRRKHAACYPGPTSEREVRERD